MVSSRTFFFSSAKCSRARPAKSPVAQRVMIIIILPPSSKRESMVSVNQSQCFSRGVFAVGLFDVFNEVVDNHAIMNKKPISKKVMVVCYLQIVHITFLVFMPTNIIFRFV